MHGNGDALTDIALVCLIALVCGLALIRARQPAIVGYILAGVVLGPAGLALVDNSGAIQLLAEVGVLLLLFLIGLELNLQEFRAVLGTALAAVGLQILGSAGLMFALGWLFDWPLLQIVVLSFAITLSSTAVAVKMLEDVGEADSLVGRLTLGVLIGQDLALVPMLIILGALGAGAGAGAGAEASGDVAAHAAEPAWLLIGKLLLAMAGLVALIAVLTRRGRIRLPFSRNRLSPDIATLAIMAFCFALASLSGLAGLSPALGAFIAGMIIGNSTGRVLAIRLSLPIQSILMVVFFLSVGLLIDGQFLIEHWGQILMLLFGLVLAKTALNTAILMLLRRPWSEAFAASLFMAHVGEFSFVLIGAGLAAGALDQSGYKLALTVIALSLVISPLWYVSLRRFHDLAANRLPGLRQGLSAIYRGELNLLSSAGQLVVRAGGRIRPAWRRPRDKDEDGPPSAAPPGP